MTNSTKVLGGLIREMRESQSLTQQELGSKAGYRAGAGVAISRIEAGMVCPSPAKFRGIANALGTTSTALENKAQRRGESIEPESEEQTDGSDNKQSVKNRLAVVQGEFERRTKLIEALGSRFNTAHDKARDEFLMAFISVAEKIEGAPLPGSQEIHTISSTSEHEQLSEAQEEAVLRQQATEIGIKHVLATGAAGAATGGAVGGAAAYGAFTAAVSFGTASTGAAISGLSGVAATNAATALLGGGTLAAGGAGIAGGTALLGALVAGPAVLLALGGAFWMYRKKRSKEQESKLDAAEANLKDTAGGVAALELIIPAAAEILEYIALHASHALSRWKRDLGPLPVNWETLTESDRAQYEAFVEVSACQLSVVSIKINDIAAVSDDERRPLVEFAEEVLARSRRSVEALV